MCTVLCSGLNIPIILATFLEETEKVILNYIWNDKRYRMEKIIFKRTKLFSLYYLIAELIVKLHQ